MFYMETHWLVSITVMSQGVCISDQSLKFSAPQPPPPCPKFFKCPHDLWPYFAKTTILKGKNLMLWDKALIESYFLPTCLGIPKNICLICACHRLLLFWQEKFEVSFSSDKISLFKVTSFWWGNFEQLWLCLFDIKACAMKQLFSHLEKRGCGDLSLCD